MLYQKNMKEWEGKRERKKEKKKERDREDDGCWKLEGKIPAFGGGISRSDDDLCE